MSDLSLAKKLIRECQETQSPYLDLGNCGITSLYRLPELFKCRHLKTLILSNEWWDIKYAKITRSTNVGKSNRIDSIPFEISNLRYLETLMANGDTNKKWGISHINSLSTLSKLQNLGLGDNDIRSINGLRDLSLLKSLDLYNNPLQDTSVLSKLTSLENLDLRDLELQSFDFISRFVKLQSLHIRSNKIENIGFIETLKKLKYLTLDSFKIANFSPINKLNSLEFLTLNSSLTEDVSFLKQHSTLKSLTLRLKKLKTIEFIRHLKGIESLSIIGIKETEHLDLTPLENCDRIRDLTLYSCPVINSSSLQKLNTLKSLTLRRSHLTDISFLKGLKNLTRLDLTDNIINDIDVISGLTRLTSLKLALNEIVEIRSLKRLRHLKLLDLSNNLIKELPLSIVKLNMEVSTDKNPIDGICINKNPLESPPVEIIDQGNQSIIDWYQANRKKLNEIKVILIGDPKAGKTSLLKRLKEDSFDEDEVQTDGINIEDIDFGSFQTFEQYPILHELTGHFWDFGGQEIMNATHQFFLTNRSVYVLVLDARKDVKVSAQIRDWVKRIKSTGGNSSIVVVANQIDINPGFGFDNEYELQREFPQVKHFVKTSCKDGTEIETLKTHLAELIPRAELFNTEIDERWIRVKEKLQKDTKEEHFLNENEFLEICDEFELRRKEGQKNAITFLHDLGIVLNFKEVKAYDYYVLDPYWITYGVYQILTSAYVGKNNGLVDMDKLDFIINVEEDKKQSYRSNNYKKITYSNNQRRFLVDILNQFKLSLYLPNRSHFIIPDLLDTTEPIKITEPIRQSVDSVRFVYNYAYLPNSIMPHFMVETHPMHKEMWRTGCVLEHDDCQGLVTAYQNNISIWIIGDHKKKREFMSVIRNRINLINQDLSDKPSMLIPLPGTHQHVDYEELLEREKDGEGSYTLYKPEKKKFIIKTLLEGIASEKEVGNNDLLKEIQDIKAGITTIQVQLDTHFKYLIALPGNQEIKDDLNEAIKGLNPDQAEAASQELMHFIVEALKIQKDSIEDRLNQVHNDLKKTDDFQLKLKLGTPLARELGVGIEGEFDIKNWAKKMYEKHDLKIFRLFGWVE